MPLEKNCPSLCFKSFTCKQENCFLSPPSKVTARKKPYRFIFIFFNYSFHYYYLSIWYMFSFFWPAHPDLRKDWVFIWHETTLQPWCNEGPRNWQNFFAITRLRHIEILFHTFTIISERKPRTSLYRGSLLSRFHCMTNKLWKTNWSVWSGVRAKGKKDQL